MYVYKCLMHHDRTYERERKNLIEEDDEGQMSEAETEKAFMKPNEDDNDVVSESDDTQDE